MDCTYLMLGLPGSIIRDCRCRWQQQNHLCDINLVSHHEHNYYYTFAGLVFLQPAEVIKNVVVIYTRLSGAPSSLTQKVA